MRFLSTALIHLLITYTILRTENLSREQNEERLNTCGQHEPGKILFCDFQKIHLTEFCHSRQHLPTIIIIQKLVLAVLFFNRPEWWKSWIGCYCDIEKTYSHTVFACFGRRNEMEYRWIGIWWKVYGGYKVSLFRAMRVTLTKNWKNWKNRKIDRKYLKSGRSYQKVVNYKNVVLVLIYKIK